MRRCVWWWRFNDAQRETASLSRYAAVHVLRPERADTGGACQLPVFGKGVGIKANGSALMALGVRCHAELDQGQTMTKEERRNAQYEWIAKTWAALAEQGKVAV